MNILPQTVTNKLISNIVGTDTNIGSPLHSISVCTYVWRVSATCVITILTSSYAT